MSIFISTTGGTRRARGRRLVAATLFAAAVATGAASIRPAIAGALPPPPGPGAKGGWDIEAYDYCVAQYGKTRFCCENSGGINSRTGGCRAPAAANA
jgi:hypothetical protein